MTEALKIREKAAGKEYPETKAAFGRVRAAAVEKMFATLPSQPEKREELYRLVHILDEVERELMAAMGPGNDAIEAYIETLGEETVR